MGPVASIIVIGLGAGLVALFIFLSVTRSRVMRYHDADTPEVLPFTHGGGGGGGV